MIVGILNFFIIIVLLVLVVIFVNNVIFGLGMIK